MIQLTTAAAMQKAIDRAKASNLLVQVVEWRHYRVTNRNNGTQYAVNFFIRNGKRFGHCTCKGGMAGFACKHLSAAAALHTCLAAQKRDA